MKNKMILLLTLIMSLGLILFTSQLAYAYDGYGDMPVDSFRPNVAPGLDTNGTYSILSNSSQSGGYTRFIIRVKQQFTESTGSNVMFGGVNVNNTTINSISHAFITPLSSTSLSTLAQSYTVNLDTRDWVYYTGAKDSAVDYFTIYLWVQSADSAFLGQMFLFEFMDSTYMYNSGFAPSMADALQSFYIGYGDYQTDGYYSQLLEERINKARTEGYNKGYEEAADFWLDVGFQEGFNSNNDYWPVLWGAVTAPFALFEVNVFPGVTLGMIALIPIVFGLIGFLFSLGGKKK